MNDIEIQAKKLAPTNSNSLQNLNIYRISFNILLCHSFVAILQNYVFYSKIVFDIWFQIFTLPWCEKVSTFAKNKDISAFLNGLWPRSTSKSKPCKTKSFKNGSDSVVDHI